MKKVITIVITIFTANTISAQNNGLQQSTYIDHDIFNICASIFVVALFMIFILNILKRHLEYRLKNKIVDKGIPENVALSILQTNGREHRNINIKWFAILAGIGVGLTIVNYTLPLGIHSLAIMSFSVALSFLVYYFFTRHADK